MAAISIFTNSRASARIRRPNKQRGKIISQSWSATEPQWAGIVADLNQNALLDFPGAILPGYSAAPGWDPASGWGTPNPVDLPYHGFEWLDHSPK
jgi:hypothetical protein